LIGKVRIIGVENVPEQGAYLIAINHISIIEPPFVLAFWPVAPEAVGAQEIWERRGQSTLARLYGGIPVRRGEYDRRLLDNMVDVLASGYPLLIAPEGGRSHTPGMGPALPGVAYVVDKARVPVIPVGIVGSTEDFLKRALQGDKPAIEMRIGEQIILPGIEAKGEVRRSALKRNSDMIMYKLAELLPQEYRGVYGKRDQGFAETT
jgi:1-acyl-sn-glycerol-3-phosphate acyltransferase